MTDTYFTVCSIDDCKRKVVARGYCTLHYHRFKTGREMRGKPMRQRGSGTIHKGYIYHGDGGRKRQQHIIVAETALGKPLPAKAVVHHIDGDGVNNEPGNLVICQDQAYHMLLHQRARALMACGHADWMKCQFCKRYDAATNLSINDHVYHRSCAAEAIRRNRNKS